MRVRTPEPRLPLEPEEYPLYKPPSRVGCSGLSIVALIAVVSFAVLFWSVTPRIVEGITGVSFFNSGDTTDGGTGEGAGAMETQTAAPAEPTPTLVAIATPTPARSCVKVSGTGGEGVALRQEPLTRAKNVVTVGEGATFELIGPDVEGTEKDREGAAIAWKHVTLPGDGRSGYVLARFVQEAPCP